MDKRTDFLRPLGITLVAVMALWLAPACSSSGGAASVHDDASSDSSSDTLTDSTPTDLGNDFIQPADSVDTGDNLDTPDVPYDLPDFWDVHHPDGFDIDTEPQPGEFGYPCLNNDECLSGYCVPYKDGQVCTTTCVEECPDGWACIVVTDTGPDAVSICLPKEHQPCQPCEADEDCIIDGDMCLEIGEGDGAGMYCTISCQEDGICPEDYSCADILGADGETMVSRQCLPDTASCVCTADLIDTSEPCSTTNDFGTCFGQRTCDGATGWSACNAKTPAAEICNNKDDNCNDEFDEGFVFVDFDGAEKAIGGNCGTGICAGGTVVCVSTTETGCSSASQAVEEVCNSKDDDCDGQTDEGVLIPFYPDLDLDGHGHSLGDIIEACVVPEGYSPTNDDCDDTDPEVAPTLAEICDGKDNNCNTGIDEVFSWAAPGGEVIGMGEACGVGECVGGTVICADLENATCSALEQATDEICDDLDQDCDGVVDNTCDDDEDGYCDADITLAGFPAVCPEGGNDCNDEDPDIHPGTPELCNGIDENCDESVDEDFTDCAPPACTGAGDDYFQTAAASCEEGACVVPDSQGCALYTCADGGSAGDICATMCEADTHCIASAHCNEGSDACVADFDGGLACVENSDCISDHCQNGFCCGAGDCCAQPSDCPESYTIEATCDDAATCQGTRQDAVCNQNQCGSSTPKADDSACTGAVLSHNCDPYDPVYCNGNVNQTEPSCADVCDADADCIDGFHCDVTCVADLDNGEACDENSDCIGEHCQNGFCCDQGDCCVVPDDCPGSYTTAPTCDDTATCQGTRLDATCAANQCGTSEALSDDRACASSQLALDCSPYLSIYCTGELDQEAPACPTSCTADSECIEGFHCDGTCVADLDNGGVCDENSDCATGHCQNGFCCLTGACCALPLDCPASFSVSAACQNPASCQGTRQDALCEANQCAKSDPIADDSACTDVIKAKECTPYVAVYCDGQADQLEPMCDQSCTDDAQCVAGYHCDGTCVADVTDGTGCDENTDCQSGHCDNGYCCGAGTCCAQPSNCPSTFAAAAYCDNSATCQGFRQDAVCVSHQCGTSALIGDDTACLETTLALTCTPYLDRYCTGAAEQTSPQCAAKCTSDAQCKAEYHCDGVCVLDQEDGLPCNEASDCQSGHCQNGYCCGAGDCCASATNCNNSTYGSNPTCTSPSTCQGSRTEPVCNSQFQCEESGAIADDSGCNGQVASDCGPYPAVQCSGAVDQSAPSCATACGSDSQCDADAHCDGTCQYDLDAGGTCDEASDCALGLYCVDGVCCTSSCNGLCKRCDVAGHAGTCWNIAENSDPDGECGGVSCSGYYYGWVGSTCYTRANISAGVAACDGYGTCQDATDLCPLAGAANAQITCDSTCQTPSTGSCSGLIPGACTNINPGTQSCGQGACYNVVNQCVNGAPITCNPLPAGAETCNDIDDDCDGTVDEDISGAADNHEPNNSCTAPENLGDIPEGGSWNGTGTIYPQGDNDYFKFKAVEGGGFCVPFTSQTFRVTVQMSPPTGGDCRNYNLTLYSDGCAALKTSSLSSCSAESITYDWGGTCTFNDDKTLRIRVSPSGSADWECEDYQLHIEFTEL